MSGPASDVITQSQFIRAGAGAGKTTKLISSFLDFVRQFKATHKRYPRVVMTTFTRKATQEVKERLLVSALKAGEKDIFEYINKKSYVHISTIHGLLSLYLAQYAELMKFPQEIRIIDAFQFERTLKRKINEILKEQTQYLELLESFSFLQLVELSAKALNFKAQFKNFSFVSEAELQSLADKKKQDLIEDLQKIFTMVPEPPEAWVTYFAFLKATLSLLQKNSEQEFFEHIELLPVKPRWSNAKPAFDPLAHALIEDLKDEKFKKPFDSQSYIQMHQKQNEMFFKFIKQLDESVLQHKKSTGELTISDLENLSLQLIEEYPASAAEFSNTWDYFMVDEYQDTSPLQVRILNQLIQDKPCFVVGDPQQSIYLFRGARSEVFVQKQEEMQARGAQINFLDMNYRSEPTLMNFINAFFDKFSRQFTAMRPKETGTTEKTLGYDAIYIKSDDELAATLSQIDELINKGVNPQDICVLSRNNGKLAELALKAHAVGIPVQLQAAAGFEERREIIDLIAFNRFLNNPHDNENLVTLARSPWFYIDDAEILNLAQGATAKKLSLWSALFNSNHEQKKHLARYLEMFESWGALQATQAFLRETSFLNLSEYYDKTGKREANIFKYIIGLAEAEKNAGFSLGLFLDEQFQTLQSDLGSSNSEAQPVLQPNCVSLMTVHASKGLQFKHVIVIGFADNPVLSKTPRLSFDEVSQKFSLAVLNNQTSKFDSSDWAQMLNKKNNERELLENERVLYVAMTRAIESLSLVVEVKKRAPSEKSWYKKSDWPAVGETQIGSARILSIENNEKLQFRELESKNYIKAREKFAQVSEQTDSAQSVTELISSKTSAKNLSDFESGLLNLQKAQKGSDLHRVFEAMKYLSSEQIMQSLKAPEQELVNYLLSQKDVPLVQILEKGHNEWGFGLKTAKRFIQGQIDLWGELESEVHVLDYKTGSSQYSDKAFEQLAFYTMALFQMNQISKEKVIVHSVVYPVEKVVKIKKYKNQSEFIKSVAAPIMEAFK